MDLSLFRHLCEHFINKIAFFLQIIHPSRFKIYLESENVQINQQILAMVLEFTCARIYITDAGLKNY